MKLLSAPIVLICVGRPFVIAELTSIVSTAVLVAASKILMKPEAPSVGGAAKVIETCVSVQRFVAPFAGKNVAGGSVVLSTVSVALLLGTVPPLLLTLTR